MNKLRLTVFFLAFLMLVIAVHATYPIWSNEATDTTSGYTVVLSPTTSSGVLYSNVTYSALLKLGSVAVTGATINFYNSSDSTTWSLILTGTTDASGIAQFTINRTAIGIVHYKAEYDAT